MGPGVEIKKDPDGITRVNMGVDSQDVYTYVNNIVHIRILYQVKSGFIYVFIWNFTSLSTLFKPYHGE